jgi:hypothetical protein
MTRLLLWLAAFLFVVLASIFGPEILDAQENLWSGKIAMMILEGLR